MTSGFSVIKVHGWASAALACALLVSACGGGGVPTPAPTPGLNPNPNPSPPPTSTLIPNPPRDCETRGDFALCVTNHDTRTRSATVAHMTDLFFDVYPRLVERFNAGAPRTVEFSIGPSSYIAGASGNEVRYQTEWLLDHPEDYDVVVHEVMHIVQSYTTAPGWLTEGIADYVRDQYGVNNAAAGWSLQMPGAGSSYTDGYGTTGRFLLWLEARYEVEFVDMLDTELRGGSYVPDFWISYTGKTVEQLWQDYVADPAMEAAEPAAQSSPRSAKDRQVLSPTMR